MASELRAPGRGGARGRGGGRGRRGIVEEVFGLFQSGVAAEHVRADLRARVRDDGSRAYTEPRISQLVAAARGAGLVASPAASAQSGFAPTALRAGAAAAAPAQQQPVAQPPLRSKRSRAAARAAATVEDAEPEKSSELALLPPPTRRRQPLAAASEDDGDADDGAAESEQASQRDALRNAHD